MNCHELDHRIVETARGAEDAAALAHAAECPQCAARLETQRQVTAMMREYAAAFEKVSAPPRVERALEAAFRSTHAGRLTSPWQRWASAIAAGAAVVAIALGLLTRGPVEVTPVPPQPGEIATEYFPLRYGTDLTALEGAPVIRTALPRTVLLSFGVPMNPQRVAEPVLADIVLGQDGTARAIRFVQ